MGDAVLDDKDLMRFALGPDGRRRYHDGVLGLGLGDPHGGKLARLEQAFAVRNLGLDDQRAGRGVDVRHHPDDRSGKVAVGIGACLQRYALADADLADRRLGHVDLQPQGRCPDDRRDLGVGRVRRHKLAGVGDALGDIAADRGVDDRVGESLSGLIDLCLGGRDGGLGGRDGGLGRVDRLDGDGGVRPRLVELAEQRVTLCPAGVERRTRNVAAVKQALGPRQLLFGEIEIGLGRFDLRKGLGVKYLAVLNVEPDLRLPKRGDGLIDGLSLLFGLCLCLFEADAGVAVVETDQHAALFDITADVKVDLDDLAADGRGDIGRGVAGEVAGGLKIGRDRLYDRLRGGDIDDGRLRARVRVGVGRARSATAQRQCGGGQYESDRC